MQNILNILVDYIHCKDIAILNMTNKDINNILQNYHKPPSNIGYCQSCNNSTCWILYDSKIHCCTQCINKKNITSIHLVKKSIN
jgi:hypothetical protein